MTERSVSISAGCARAILTGRKTLIRQVLDDASAVAPLGPGEPVWVREPWVRDASGQVVLQAEAADADPGGGAWQPPRTMPREACRLELIVTESRVERLQEIPERELESEGALWRVAERPVGETEREGFARWWDSLHRRPGTRWADNPRVQVLHVALLPRPGLEGSVLA